MDTIRNADQSGFRSVCSSKGIVVALRYWDPDDRKRALKLRDFPVQVYEPVLWQEEAAELGYDDLSDPTFHAFLAALGKIFAKESQSVVTKSGYNKVSSEM